MDILQTIWFALIALILGIFLMTSGFDFGAGIISIFLKDSEKKDFAIKSIAPFWDANQVWLIIAGGGLFAAFPKAYSTIFSELYTPLMLLLAFLIFRICALEFYHFESSLRWKKFFLKLLSISSIVSVAIIGFALGAIFKGSICISASSFTESILRLVSPVSIATMVLALLFFSLHGALFLTLMRKDPDDAQGFAMLAKKSIFYLIIAYIGYLVISAFYTSHNIFLIYLILPYLPLRITNFMIKRKNFFSAFVSNCVFVISLVLMHAYYAFPHILRPIPKLTEGLRIDDAASSEKTLSIMLIVALLGTPLAIAYNIYAHWVFSKKNTKNKTV